MKKMWLVWFGLGLVAFVAGVFFVFGEDVLNVVGEDGFFIKGDSSSGGGYDDDEVLSSGDHGAIVGDSGGGGGDSEVVGGGDDCTSFRQVQYSLGDFVEQAECLVYGVGGCERIKMTCSARLFNLDYELGGLFEVRYFLTLGEEVLDSELIGRVVGPRVRETLQFEIAKDGSFVVEDLGCSVDMESVPKTWLC